MLNVLLVSVFSVVVLFILTKLMGNRQMSQLSMFDYINGITIGSIAAEMATSLQSDFLKPLIAMVVYATLAILISYVTDKSLKLRKIINGTSLVLFENGKIYEKNLKKARMDINEFLTQCRNSGYFNLSNIYTAILETNGKISFLPVSMQRPVTPTDMNLAVKEERPLVNVIIDGKIMKENLKITGNNEKWLESNLHKQGINDCINVFLATCDYENNLSVYIKIKG